MNAEQFDHGRSPLTSPAAAGFVLVAFWILLLASVRDKGFAYDETVHAAAGASYWLHNDYRLDPENGNLPQRLESLPLVLSGYAFPPVPSDAWRTSDEWVIADQWFHRMRHNALEMLWRGRFASTLLALALGALVWATARGLFGPAGGMLALVLYALNPTILANGALMTSDLATALFFLAASLGWWALLHRLSLIRLIGGGLLFGGLAVSKMSAVVILPIALLLLAARLAEGSPLPVGFGAARMLVGRGRLAAAFAGAALLQILLAALVIWTCYGFRYAAFAPGASGPPGSDRPYISWSTVLEEPTPAAPPTATAARALTFARRHELLPEAFLYGTAYAWHFSATRGAFLNGAYSLRGWRFFFPYAFLVKTPLALFGILVLAATAAVGRWWRSPGSLAGQIRRGLYATLPLWALLACFWTAAICSHVNIGQRHILPTYAPLFILAGAAAGGPLTAGAAQRRRLFPFALASLVGLLAAETAWRFPNYIAYFNSLVAPAEGYRHLVDSSSDWGQELPALQRYLARHPAEGPRYLAYFGSDSPSRYRIAAELTNCVLPVLDPAALPFYVEAYSGDKVRAGILDFQARHPEFDALGAIHQVPTGDYRAVFLRAAPLLRLQAGTYFISSTLLEAVKFGTVRPWDMPWGPWNRRYEETYQRLRPTVQPFYDETPGARPKLMAHLSPAELWSGLLNVLEFDEYRFARLKAFLRQRTPEDEINDAILVYHLSAADLAHALDGPPPELGPDVAALTKGNR